MAKRHRAQMVQRVLQSALQELWQCAAQPGERSAAVVEFDVFMRKCLALVIRNPQKRQYARIKFSWLCPEIVIQANEHLISREDVQQSRKGRKI